MKKQQKLIIIYLFVLLAGALLSLYKEPLTAGANQEPIVIPEEAIRLRILANSDAEQDQSLKRIIRDEVNKEITVWVEELTSVEEARELIQSRLPKIEEIVERILAEKNSVQSYSVDFGNVSFPTKLYGNFIYPAGDYEAILITLGKGQGANWWCVLFPPLCFLDFSNSEAVQASAQEESSGSSSASALVIDDEEEEVEVKFFLVEWFEDLFS
ncbi:stage II sporulation protein R [Bacillus lacus]|uniref:Stage II sporulation protein R n=1 Tax=Metabacillus lacus TaxID=1983721 RepID=A0A7X2IX47_9BACI|nr:stage II sporulation protein R [Metabacillus lacus]MRX71082.1 stage II sporulation protein R [Metabacillus lacus]